MDFLTRDWIINNPKLHRDGFSFSIHFFGLFCYDIYLHLHWDCTTESKDGVRKGSKCSSDYDGAVTGDQCSSALWECFKLNKLYLVGKMLIFREHGLILRSLSLSYS